MITAQQVKAARALASWKQSDLAAASGVAAVTIRVIEQGKVDPRASTLARLEEAFRKAGVEFTKTGVQLTDKSDYLRS